MTGRPCSLAALAMVNSLGGHPDEIWPRLIRGDQSGFRVREDLVPGLELVVAEVAGALPVVPDRLRRYDCRNNSLTLAALEPIEKRSSDRSLAVGRDRVGVVMGTSTSGVSDAEVALRHRVETGVLAAVFGYAQLEFGGVAGFVARVARLCRPCLHDLDGVLVGRPRPRLRPFAARPGPLRRRDRRRDRQPSAASPPTDSPPYRSSPTPSPIRSARIATGSRSARARRCSW